MSYENPESENYLFRKIKEKKQSAKNKSAADIKDEELVEKTGLTSAHFFQKIRGRITNFFTPQKKTTRDDTPRRQPVIKSP